MSKKTKKKVPTGNIEKFTAQQKAMRWYKSLNFVQREYVLEYGKMTQLDFQRVFLEHIDTVMTATLIQEFEDMSLNEIHLVLEKFTELFIEHIDSKKNDRYKGEDEIMSKRKELEPKILKYVNELIDKNLNQKESLADLKIKFPTITASELTNCYKRCKEMRKAADKLKKVAEVKPIEIENTEEAMDYIFKTEKEEYKVPKKIKEVVLENLKENKKDDIQTREDEVKEIIERVSKLKVISREVKAVGIYGEYVRSETGVSHGALTFENEKDIESQTLKRISEIDEELKIITQKIKDFGAEKDWLIGREEEIKEMFQI